MNRAGTFAVCLAAMLPAVAWADSYTWDGGGANVNWTNHVNWAGDSGFPNSSTDTAVFDGSAPRQPTVNSNVDLQILNVTGSTNWTWGGSSAVTLYEAFNYGSTGTGTFNAVIGGTGMVVVTAGRLNLGNTNTYSGNTVIKGGTIYLNAANRISAGDIVILDTSGANSATFWAAYANQTFARNFIINAGSAGTASFIMNQGNELCTFSGTFTLGKDLYVTATSTRDRILFGGLISGDGGLIKLGTGTYSVLAITNTSNVYKGKTTVQEGELVVSSEGAMGTPDPGNEAIIITGSGILGNNDVNLTLTRPILVSSTVAGTSRIGQWGGTYDTITLQGDITVEKDLTIGGVNNSSKPLVLNISEASPGTRTISGAGGFVHSSAGTTTYSRRDSPTFQGGTTLNNGLIRWSRTATTPAGGESVGFGTGQIVPQGANFELYATQNAAGDNGVPLYLTNAILATASGGGVYGWQGTGGSSKYPNVSLSGPVNLAGILTIGSRSTGGGGNAMHQSGVVTIDQLSPCVRQLRYYQAGLAMYQEGSIVDGSGAYRNPLALYNTCSSTYEIMGTGNTYHWGTIIQSAGGPIRVAATSGLGQGDVTILGEAKLIMSSPGNLAAGKSIEVAGNSGGIGVLNVASNYLPTVASNSTGIVAIDTNNFNSITNLAALGAGGMFLGSSSTGALTCASLAPGTGNVYRLGGASGTLSLSGANLLTGTASLQVGSLNAGISYGSGIVVVNAAQNYTGGTTIGAGSRLSGVAQAGGTPFGSTTAGITLSGGALELVGIGSATTTEIGELTVLGYGRVKVTPGASGNTALNAASLTSSLSIATSPSSRSTHEVLYIDPAVNAGTARFTVTGASSASPLPGYFLSTANTGGAGDFAKYTATGFTALSGSDYTVLSNSWTNIVADESQVVDRSGANLNSGNQTLAAALNPKIYGLKHGTTSPNYNCLNLNGNVLTVGPGGIIFTQLYSSWDNNQIQGSVTFADAAGNPVEGFIYVGSDNGGGQMGCFTITSIITAGAGLTFSGPGTFYRGTGNNMTPGNLHNVAGTVTVHQARLVLGGGGAGGSTSQTNNFVLDQGAILTCDNYGSDSSVLNLSANGSVTIGPGGATIAGGPYGYTCAINASGPILNPSSGPTGPLTLKGGGGTTSFTLSNAGNTYSGGTVIRSCTVTVNAGSSLGTGDVILQYGGTLNLLDSANIASTACLIFNSGGTAYFKCSSPAIASLEGLGNVVLGTAGTNAALTINNSTNISFYGNISQGTSSTGSVTKTGVGTLTLKGTNSYAGATAVNAGGLVLDGSIGGNVSVASGATLGGHGRINGDLTMANGAIFSAVLNATNDLTRLMVTGTVTLAVNTVLSTTLGYQPSSSETICLMVNPGGNAVSGTFSNALEGTRVTLGTYNGRILEGTISYFANADGTANDIALTNISEPGGGTMVIIE